jgi:hypothetical protein
MLFFSAYFVLLYLFHVMFVAGVSLDESDRAKAGTFKKPNLM